MMISSSLETIEDGTHILVERIAELEAGGTAYDAGYQAAKADMEERVYRAEAALDSFLGLDGGKTVVELRATIFRLRQDIGWRDRDIDALEAKLEGVAT